MKKHVTSLALLTCATLVVEAVAQRAYSAGYHMLSLDGAAYTFLNNVEGGAVSAEVIRDFQGAYPPAKHLGQPIYEAFNIQLGFSRYDAALHSWIAAAWNQDHQRKSGTLITADSKLETSSQREFRDALITETTFPACVGASREPAHISLKFAPEYTRKHKTSGTVSGDISRTAQKTWRASDYRLRIDGLDCVGIVRIESFTVKHPRGQSIGSRRDYDLQPAGFEFPNLKITLAPYTSQTWQDWFETFVHQGKNGPEDEKQGTLEFLSSDGREVMATLRFDGLGIFRLEEGASQTAADAFSRVTAELYCEKMSFIPGNGKP